MIVFISCTKQKQNRPCTAKIMYSTSAWFCGAYKYAKSLNPEHIYILSAKYGLLKEDTIISPYERTLNSAKDAEIKEWSKMVAKQIEVEDVDTSQKAVFLCGRNYRKYVKNLFKEYEVPLEHLGIGKQLKFFNERERKPQ